MSTSFGPSSDSTDTVAPRAAATIGIVSVQCRSSPCRSKIACGRCTTSRNRSPGGPPPGADPAVAVALGAGPREHRPVAAAVGAGLGGDHLAEERLADLADLAPPGADRAGFRVSAGRGPLTGAGRADHGGVHRELTGGTEGALRQVELDPDRRVAAAPGPRPGAPGGPGAGRAEDRVHELAEGESRGAAEAAEPARAGPRERVTAHVVQLALLRVLQDLVGLVDLLELLLRLRVRVDVRVQLPGQPAVRPLDLVLRGVAADPEHSVIVLSHYDSPRICPTYRATARTAPIVPG